ncbi:CinA family protein [Marisediminicola senii]|uniref:CinA family protein n=1 Tax=Marisediminicola senii TaxID=2711233 RepID=UPI0013EB1A9C|nr:CinA family protein [Marisediminicola senii]
MTGTAGPDARAVIEQLAEAGFTIAVAESLTGGLVAAALTAVPGASAVVSGGVVSYSTAIKHSVLGVSRELLDIRGPVDPDVAAQMASGVRRVLAIDGTPADVGVATTGVAGPGAHDGHPAGTAFVAVDVRGELKVIHLSLTGDRDAIRAGVVSESLAAIVNAVAAG